MALVYALLPLVVFVILFLIKKVSYKKIINGIFLGIVAVFVSLFFTGVVAPLLGYNGDLDMAILTVTGQVTIQTIIVAFISAALPEELSKFLLIKIPSKNNRNDTIIYSILVAVGLETFENVGYAGEYGALIMLKRVLAPGHLLFQLIMLAFLLLALKSNKKGQKVLYNCLALIIPIVLHTLWDAGLASANIFWYIVGIITYAAAIFAVTLIKDEKNNNSKVKLFPLKATLLVLSMIILVWGGFFESGNTKLNETVNIEEENIEFTVTEKIKSETEEYIGEETTFAVVTAKVTNNGTESYRLNTYDVTLLTTDSKKYDATYYEIEGKEMSFDVDDDSYLLVEPNETVTMYIKFETDETNFEYLRFRAGDLLDPTYYTFNVE